MELFFTEMNVKDPELNHLVNIGFPRSDATTISSRYKSRLSSWIMKRRNNERASRLNECRFFVHTIITIIFAAFISPANSLHFEPF